MAIHSIPSCISFMHTLLRRSLRQFVLPLLLISCGVPALAPAQAALSAVTFSGNTFLSQRQLLDQLQLAPGQPMSIVSTLKERVEALYRLEGFYTATVDSFRNEFSSDSALASVTVYLTEGERTLISSIAFSGNVVLSTPRIRAVMETSEGEPLRVPLLESDIRSILDLYGRSGYPFAAVNSDSLVPMRDDPSRLNVSLTIDEGAPMVIDEIQATGNTVTALPVIAREARIPPGALYDMDRAEEFLRRLERLQLFASVGAPELFVRSWTPGDTVRGGIRIAVTEGNANSFDGIVGYVPPPTAAEKGYFTGNIFISMRNLFGTGRRAMIKWMRETALTQELELQYREPWVFSVPLSLGLSFRQRKQDSTFVRTSIEGRGEYQLSDVLTVAGHVSMESVTPSSSLQVVTVYRTETVSTGIEVQVDTRDQVRNPTSGIQYIATAQQGTKSITGPESLLPFIAERSFSIQRYAVDAEFFVSVAARQVLMFGLHGKQVSASRLEYSDLFPFGGAASLRGYRENQFFASRFAYITGEYRFLTGRASSLFGFIDAGYFSRPSDALRNITRTERSLYGYGAGTRIETALGIMNVSFALGEGDGFSAGKIHIGLVGQF